MFFWHSPPCSKLPTRANADLDVGREHHGVHQADFGFLTVCKAKISIVDDDKFVLKALEHLIGSLGYEVNVFLSAEDFLMSDRAQDTSCLVTDLQMPGMTGIELQKRLVANGHHLPIIFMSGVSDEEIRVGLLKAGAIGFLTKPVDMVCLIDLLNKALEG